MLKVVNANMFHITLKPALKVITIIGAAAIAFVSTSCTNQEKVEQAKRCEDGEVLVSQELEKLDVLAMRGKAIYQKAMGLKKDRGVGMILKLVDKMEDIELEAGEATQILIGRWEDYVEACQDEEREDKFREEKLNPVVNRLKNINKS